MSDEKCTVCGADLPMDHAANLFPDGKRACLGCERRLHLFESGNPDWVIAFDEDDAHRLWCEHTGEKPEDYDNDWSKLADDTKSSYWLDPETGTITDDSGVLTEMTSREAVEKFGRGYLASVDF